jgi:hypothetical protein
MRRALRLLARNYPNRVEISSFAEFDAPGNQRVLFYLAEKGFVEPGKISDRYGRDREMLEATVTARGLDWLEKGHTPETTGNEPSFGESEAFRLFLVQSIKASALSEEIKVATSTRLLSFSGEDLKALQRRLLQAMAEKPELIAKLVMSGAAPR